MRRRLLLVSSLALGVVVAPSAGATVRLNSDWIVTPRVGMAPSPPYLHDSSVAPYTTLGGVFLESPTGLAGAPSSSTTCLAHFTNPFDSGAPLIEFTCEAAATGGYDAAHGVLSASGSVDARVDPASYVAVPSGGGSPIQLDNPWVPGGDVYFELRSIDEVTFSSASAPIGTPIEVVAHMQHAPIVQSTAGTFPTFARASMETSLGGVTHDDGSYSSFVPGGGTFGATDRSESGALVIDEPDHVQTTLSLVVGDALYVRQSLIVAARADAYTPDAPQSAGVADTATLWFEAPAIVEVTGTTGERYAPEPEAVAGSYAAAVGLAALRRRRPRAGR